MLELIRKSDGADFDPALLPPAVPVPLDPRLEAVKKDLLEEEQLKAAYAASRDTSSTSGSGSVGARTAVKSPERRVSASAFKVSVCFLENLYAYVHNPCACLLTSVIELLAPYTCTNTQPPHHGEALFIHPPAFPEPRKTSFWAMLCCMGPPREEAYIAPKAKR